MFFLSICGFIELVQHSCSSSNALGLGTSLLDLFPVHGTRARETMNDSESRPNRRPRTVALACSGCDRFLGTLASVTVTVSAVSQFRPACEVVALARADARPAATTCTGRFRPAPQ